MHLHTQTIGKKLNTAIIITIALVVCESIVGFYAHSLALISDAGHNLADVFSLAVSWLAINLQTRPASISKTYGLQRVGILSAFINSSALVLIAAFIFYEGIHRLFSPKPTNSIAMIIASSIGLAINLIIATSLYNDSKHDINVRSTFVHMLGDSLSTLGVLIGSFLIYITGWTQIDAIVSLLIGFVVLLSSWFILKDSVHLLLEGTPRNVNIDDIVKEIKKIKGILDVHHMHIWSLSPQVIALSCHVKITNIPMEEADLLVRSVEHLLSEQHKITHTTIQLECQSCPKMQTYCHPISI